MTGARDIAQLCFSSNLTGIVANKIEQSFYSVYSYSGIESSEHALKAHANGHGRNKCQQLPTMLAVVGQQCCIRLHGPKSLTGFKLNATSANIPVVPCKWTQQVTTLLGPTMLGVVGQQCWVRLHEP